MTWLTRLMIGALLATTATVAPAQQSGNDGVKFVDMIRKGDNAGAVALLQSKPIIIDATDGRGDTALLVALKNRDTDWAAHLLRSGASPNHAARNGDTPLIVASRAGFADAVGWLLGIGAKVNGANKMGETALIIAVQERELPIVEQLLEAGADPDRTDAAAGFSARDYARRETRFPSLLAAIQASKRPSPTPPSKPESKSLDDFKLD